MDRMVGRDPRPAQGGSTPRASAGRAVVAGGPKTWYFASLRPTTCDDLARHHDRLHEADRASFRQLLYTAHYEAHAASEAISWPALQCLSLELGELAKRLQ